MGAGRELPGAARIFCQPLDSHHRRGGPGVSASGIPVSQSDPALLILLAQPISLVSALFALWITDTPLNVSSCMGAILLIGLDVKNGIILIEYIGQLASKECHSRGLIKAGRTRFRPILMTSLCTILGLVPLAIGLAPGPRCSNRWQSRSSAALSRTCYSRGSHTGRISGPQGRHGGGTLAAPIPWIPAVAACDSRCFRNAQAVSCRE